MVTLEEYTNVLPFELLQKKLYVIVYGVRAQDSNNDKPILVKLMDFESYWVMNYPNDSYVCDPRARG